MYDVKNVEVKNLTKIGICAFLGMKSIERIDMDDKVTSIGFAALTTYPMNVSNPTDVKNPVIIIPDSVTTFDRQVFESNATIYCSENNKTACLKAIMTNYTSSYPRNVQEYIKNSDGSYDFLENGRAVERYASLKDFQNSNVLEKYGYDKAGNQYLLSSDGKLFLKQSDGSTYYFNEDGKLDDIQGKRIYTVDEATFMAQKGYKNKFVIKYR